MESESLITLYDSASLEGKPLGWNTMVLKARYSLNFKGVPYKTVWLEYPDIEPTMRRIGAAPTGKRPDDGSPFYTLPVIVDPSRRTPSGGPTVVSDSWKIAEYLDDAYPEPGLLLPKGSKALQMLFHDHVTKVLLYPAAPILVPGFTNFLNEASLPYWRKTREGFFKSKLEELCPKGTEKWEAAWTNVYNGFTEIAALLDKNGVQRDTLLMGDKVTFGDFIIMSVLDSLCLIAPEEWEGRVKNWHDGRWQRLKNHCANWRGVH